MSGNTAENFPPGAELPVVSHGFFTRDQVQLFIAPLSTRSISLVEDAPDDAERSDSAVYLLPVDSSDDQTTKELADVDVPFLTNTQIDLADRAISADSLAGQRPEQENVMDLYLSTMYQPALHSHLNSFIKTPSLRFPEGSGAFNDTTFATYYASYNDSTCVLQLTSGPLKVTQTPLRGFSEIPSNVQGIMDDFLSDVFDSISDFELKLHPMKSAVPALSATDNSSRNRPGPRLGDNTCKKSAGKDQVILFTPPIFSADVPIKVMVVDAKLGVASRYGLDNRPHRSAGSSGAANHMNEHASRSTAMNEIQSFRVNPYFSENDAFELKKIENFGVRYLASPPLLSDSYYAKETAGHCSRIFLELFKATFGDKLALIFNETINLRMSGDLSQKDLGYVVSMLAFDSLSVIYAFQHVSSLDTTVECIQDFGWPTFYPVHDEFKASIYICEKVEQYHDKLFRKVQSIRDGTLTDTSAEHTNRGLDMLCQLFVSIFKMKKDEFVHYWHMRSVEHMGNIPHTTGAFNDADTAVPATTTFQPPQHPTGGDSLINRAMSVNFKSVQLYFRSRMQASRTHASTGILSGKQSLSRMPMRKRRGSTLLEDDRGTGPGKCSHRGLSTREGDSARSDYPQRLDFQQDSKNVFLIPDTVRAISDGNNIILINFKIRDDSGFQANIRLPQSVYKGVVQRPIDEVAAVEFRSIVDAQYYEQKYGTTKPPGEKLEGETSSGSSDSGDDASVSNSMASCASRSHTDANARHKGLRVSSSSHNASVDAGDDSDDSGFVQYSSHVYSSLLDFSKAVRRWRKHQTGFLLASQAPFREAGAGDKIAGLGRGMPLSLKTKAQIVRAACSRSVVLLDLDCFTGVCLKLALEPSAGPPIVYPLFRLDDLTNKGLYNNGVYLLQTVRAVYAAAIRFRFGPAPQGVRTSVAKKLAELSHAMRCWPEPWTVAERNVLCTLLDGHAFCSSRDLRSLVAPGSTHAGLPREAGGDAPASASAPASGHRLLLEFIGRFVDNCAEYGVAQEMACHYSAAQQDALAALGRLAEARGELMQNGVPAEQDPSPGRAPPPLVQLADEQRALRDSAFPPGYVLSNSALFGDVLDPAQDYAYITNLKKFVFPTEEDLNECFYYMDTHPLLPNVKLFSYCASILAMTDLFLCSSFESQKELISLTINSFLLRTHPFSLLCSGGARCSAELASLVDSLYIHLSTAATGVSSSFDRRYVALTMLQRMSCALREGRSELESSRLRTLFNAVVGENFVVQALDNSGPGLSGLFNESTRAPLTLHAPVYQNLFGPAETRRHYSSNSSLLPLAFMANDRQAKNTALTMASLGGVDDAETMELLASSVAKPSTDTWEYFGVSYRINPGNGASDEDAAASRYTFDPEDPPVSYDDIRAMADTVLNRGRYITIPYGSESYGQVTAQEKARENPHQKDSQIDSQEQENEAQDAELAATESVVSTSAFETSLQHALQKTDALTAKSLRVGAKEPRHAASSSTAKADAPSTAGKPTNFAMSFMNITGQEMSVYHIEEEQVQFGTLKVRANAVLRILVEWLLVYEPALIKFFDVALSMTGCAVPPDAGIYRGDLDATGLAYSETVTALFSVHQTDDLSCPQPNQTRSKASNGKGVPGAQGKDVSSSSRPSVSGPSNRRTRASYAAARGQLEADTAQASIENSDQYTLGVSHHLRGCSFDQNNDPEDDDLIKYRLFSREFDDTLRQIIEYYHLLGRAASHDAICAESSQLTFSDDNLNRCYAAVLPFPLQVCSGDAGSNRHAASSNTGASSAAATEPATEYSNSSTGPDTVQYSTASRRSMENQGPVVSQLRPFFDASQLRKYGPPPPRIPVHLQTFLTQTYTTGTLLASVLLDPMIGVPTLARSLVNLLARATYAEQRASYVWRCLLADGYYITLDHATVCLTAFDKKALLPKFVAQDTKRRVDDMEMHANPEAWDCSLDPSLPDIVCAAYPAFDMAMSVFRFRNSFARLVSDSSPYPPEEQCLFRRAGAMFQSTLRLPSRVSCTDVYQELSSLALLSDVPESTLHIALVKSFELTTQAVLGFDSYKSGTSLQPVSLSTSEQRRGKDALKTVKGMLDGRYSFLLDDFLLEIERKYLLASTSRPSAKSAGKKALKEHAYTPLQRDSMSAVVGLLVPEEDAKFFGDMLDSLFSQGIALDLEQIFKRDGATEDHLTQDNVAMSTRTVTMPCVTRRSFRTLVSVLYPSGKVGNSLTEVCKWLLIDHVLTPIMLSPSDGDGDGVSIPLFRYFCSEIYTLIRFIFIACTRIEFCFRLIELSPLCRQVARHGTRSMSPIPLNNENARSAGATIFGYSDNTGNTIVPARIFYSSSAFFSSNMDLYVHSGCRCGDLRCQFCGGLGAGIAGISGNITPYSVGANTYYELTADAATGVFGSKTAYRNCDASLSSIEQGYYVGPEGVLIKGSAAGTPGHADGELITSMSQCHDNYAYEDIVCCRIRTNPATDVTVSASVAYHAYPPTTTLLVTQAPAVPLVPNPIEREQDSEEEEIAAPISRKTVRGSAKDAISRARCNSIGHIMDLKDPEAIAVLSDAAARLHAMGSSRESPICSAATGYHVSNFTERLVDTTIHLPPLCKHTVDFYRESSNLFASAYVSELGHDFTVVSEPNQNDADLVQVSGALLTDPVIDFLSVSVDLSAQGSPNASGKPTRSQALDALEESLIPSHVLAGSRTPSRAIVQTESEILVEILMSQSPSLKGSSRFGSEYISECYSILGLYAYPVLGIKRLLSIIHKRIESLSVRFASHHYDIDALSLFRSSKSTNMFNMSAVLLLFGVWQETLPPPANHVLPLRFSKQAASLFSDASEYLYLSETHNNVIRISTIDMSDQDLLDSGK